MGSKAEEQVQSGQAARAQRQVQQAAERARAVGGLRRGHRVAHVVVAHSGHWQHLSAEPGAVTRLPSEPAHCHARACKVLLT